MLNLVLVWSDCPARQQARRRAWRISLRSVHSRIERAGGLRNGRRRGETKGHLAHTVMESAISRIESRTDSSWSWKLCGLPVARAERQQTSKSARSAPPRGFRAERPSFDFRISSFDLHRIFFPRAELMSPTPRIAVLFMMSIIGLTSTSSSANILPLSATISRAR
jgi:hypothetical protein